MVPFVIGFIAGSFVTLGILGFFVATVSDEQPEPPRPEELPYYMEDDGK